eukprot:TRINITY_DN3038_c0_g1_i3.p1 TRINITY_DN3038_c0_g1~~TRINITY_DN3038_c0_g1_i3.p1  ORF type:complete len:399 (+),score=70.03 TRINITY_DN3038_c0_g1_i3:89-1285(+)
MSITSDEINYLIYRYLKEAGFEHSAFVFGSEGIVKKAIFAAKDVPVGTLIHVLQKGLQYLEIETHVKEDGTEIVCDEPFSLVRKHVCKRPREKNTSNLVTNTNPSTTTNTFSNVATSMTSTSLPSPPQQNSSTQSNQTTTSTHTPVQSLQTQSQAQTHPVSPQLYSQTFYQASGSRMSSQSKDLSELKKEEKDMMEEDLNGSEEAEPMNEDDAEEKILIREKNSSILSGHRSEVFMCAWNPKSSLLASGSGDSTARIWTIPEGRCGVKAGQSASKNPIVLKHFNANQEKSKDVTTLDWSPQGTLLATGSYDGLARIWDCKGNLKNTLKKHKGPIFSLKWNKTGEYLLSGSVDKTAVIWDPKTGEVKQQFEFHSGDFIFEICFSSDNNNKHSFKHLKMK